jgi:hypothetical protein
MSKWRITDVVRQTGGSHQVPKVKRAQVMLSFPLGNDLCSMCA